MPNKYIRFITIISLVFSVFILNSSKISASDTITYKDSSIFKINNDYNTLEIYPDQDREQIIHKVPISVRAKLRNEYAEGSPKKRYNITVSNSNNFVSIAKAPNHKTITEQTINLVSSTSHKVDKKADKFVGISIGTFFILGLLAFIFNEIRH